MTVQGCKVFISEYNAPPDFECVWAQEIINNLNDKKAVERLFTYTRGVLNADS